MVLLEDDRRPLLLGEHRHRSGHDATQVLSSHALVEALDPFALSGQFTCAVNPPKGLGSAFYCNPEYDKLMEASRKELDPKKRLALLADASKMVWDDAPWIFLHVEKFVIAYSSKIKGMVVTPTEKFYPTYINVN